MLRLFVESEGDNTRSFIAYATEPRNVGERSTIYREKVSLPNSRNGHLRQSTNSVGLCQA